MGRYSDEALEKGRLANFAKFVKDANVKFNGRFDYSQVNYVAQKVAVDIICPTHGRFTQTPTKHLTARYGCPKCGVNSRSEKRLDDGRERFLQSFSERFADTLEMVGEYVSVKDRIRLRCKLHGSEYETTPDALNVSKFGCHQCAAESIGISRRLTQEDFEAKSRELFGDQFDLSKSIYSDITSSVSIGCPIHGAFEIKPASFLTSKHGCPKCGRLNSGYAAERIRKIEARLVKPRPTTLALMKVEVFGITAFKLGITSRKLIDRYASALREIMFEATLDELDALRLEQHLHGKYFRGRDMRIFLAGLRGGKRWPGDSEIYKSEFLPEILADLQIAMKAIEGKDPDYWKGLPGLVAPILRIRTVRKSEVVFAAPKRVIRLDTMEIYPTVTAAAKAVGSTQALVSMVCSGKRRHTKQIKFAFLEDQVAESIPAAKDFRGAGANHVKARAVRCIETGVVYSTLTEAAKVVDVGSGKITMVCKGKRKSAGGFRWEYVST